MELQSFVLLISIFETHFSRKPFELKEALLAYNLSMTVLNAYICIELWTASVSLGYSYVCQPVRVDYSKNEMRVSSA